MSIKRKKRAVPITPQNELPNGQFSVELFTYLEKKIQVNEEDRIKKMLKAPEQKDVSKTNSSSIENSILKKIRK